MWNKKLGFATLALGSFLTLLAPAAAVARDRDDYRENTSFRDNYRNNYRERERRERFERFERQQRRNREHRYDWHR